MKETKRLLSLVLALVMIMSVCCMAFVGCDDKTPSNPSQKPTSTTPTELPTENPTEKPSENTQTPQPTASTYTVSVKTAGGMALSNVMVFIQDGESIVSYVTTDEKGEASVDAPTKDTYVATVPNTPAGYTAQASYAFVDKHANVVLTSAVIKEGSPSKTYELGDVMYDFTVTTYDDKEEMTLSEILKEKDMVLINYWFDGCGYCLQEFPELNEVYNRYSDSVEVLALSPIDNDAAIAAYMERYIKEGALPAEGLSFPVAYDDQGIIANFNPSGAPTSIVVDRYGVICFVIEGAMSAHQFQAIFDYFTGDDYQQQLISDPSILTPVAKPNVSMPSSEEIGAVLNKGDISVTYRGEANPEDAEYAWPFIIGEKNGETCIKTSNAFKHSTYSIIYADVELKAGQAIAFDYWASTELGADILYILVDRQDMYQLSGDGDDWDTVYPYVALEDGTYELALCYIKDSGSDVGDDTMYIKDLRIVDASEIDKETYIFRHAANDFNDLGSGYNSYVEVVLGEDGYYHVGTADGPILLANLMGYTRFSNTMSVWMMAYNGLIKLNGIDYVDQFEEYSNYSVNSRMYGYCSVNEELRELLEIVCEAVGTEADNPNEWLQMCVYYDAYGTNGEQMMDPIKGLAIFSAFEAKLDIANEVTYTQIVMPRGYLYAFTPEESGVYRITSYSTAEGIVDGVDYAIDAWLFDENHELIYTYEHAEKMWQDTKNVSMLVYIKAGETCYMDLAYYDIYASGSFTFRIEREGDVADIFTHASPGPFTMPDDGDGEIDYGATPEATGVDVMLVDGKYYVKNEDGTQGPVLYADFWTRTGLFSHSIEDAIKLDGFNFDKTSLDVEIEGFIEEFEAAGIDEAQGFKEAWGEYLYAQRVELIEEVKNGIYHGAGDYTEQMQAYLDQVITNNENEELNGCIEMTEELAEILQMFMDRYSLEGVEHSWTKLCFYYKHYGPTVAAE